MPATNKSKSRKVIKIFLTIILFFVLILTILFFSIFTFFSNMGECLMDTGPFYGDKIEINLDTIPFDQIIEIPNGKLAFANTQDSISPLFIKINQQEEVVWSYRLHTDDDEYLSLHKIGNIRLSENHSIDFFNHSFSEPGYIYLDKNYDFECVCLKVF